MAGAICVDTGNTASPHERDLELLSAIARVVGVAVGGARLYRNVERERLAALGMATAGLGHHQNIAPAFAARDWSTWPSSRNSAT